MAKKSIINQFQLGDIVEICFHPKQEPKEWVKFLSLPLRDRDDIEKAKELVQTNGACLGIYSAVLANRGDYHEFRTVTPPAPIMMLEREVEHMWNTKTGKLIGAEVGLRPSTITMQDFS